MFKIIFRVVDGEWSDWKDWSPCSTTCGAGTQERERTCTEPRPAFGGNDCVGVSRESKSCQARACPGNIIVLTFFTEAWFSVRHRHLTNVRLFFLWELQFSIISSTLLLCAFLISGRCLFSWLRCCFSSVHGDWTPWNEWTSCSKTCGAGTQTRERKCESPRPEYGGRPCEGPKEQVRVCNARNCPGRFAKLNIRE